MTEAFVRSALDRAVGPGASLHRLERGLCNFQDLYLALPEPGVDFSALDFHGEPHLIVEQASLADGGRRLELQGWAAMRSGAVREVEVMLDGERIAAAPVADPRPDVAGYLSPMAGDRYLRSGWHAACPLPVGASRTAAVLRLRVVDGRGKAQPLWAGSIEALLLAGSRMEAEKFRNELWQTQALLAEERARAGAGGRGAAEPPPRHGGEPLLEAAQRVVPGEAGAGADAGGVGKGRTRPALQPRGV